MCDRRSVRLEVLANEHPRPARVDVVRHEGTKHPKLCLQDLKGLQKLIFTMCFLDTNDVIFVSESFEVAVLLFPGGLRGGGGTQQLP